MKLVRSLLVTASAISAMVAWGQNSVWTGAALDGKWNTAGNWSGGRPINGNWDNVTVSGVNLVNGAMENNIGPMKIYSFKLQGDAAFTLDTPSLITVHSAGGITASAPSVTINGNLWIDVANASQFYITGNLEHNGSLQLNEGSTLTLKTYYGDKTVNLNGPVNGAGATMRMDVYGGSVVNFNDAIQLAKLSTSSVDYYTGVTHIKSAENAIGTLEIGHYVTYLDVENALAQDTVITWSDFYRENNSGRLRLYGLQQANRIVDENLDPSQRATSDQIASADLSVPPELWLYGTDDAVSKAMVVDDVSITWMPTDDYTQEFRDRVNTTTGNLTVFGGTLKIGGVGSFNNVNTVSAYNGTFEVASSVAALTGLKALVVGEGGRFKVATTVAPFSEKQAEVTIADGGVLELPAGVQLPVAKVSVDGNELANGYYGCIGNSQGWIEAAWIEGDGSVMVSATVPEVETETATWKGAAEDNSATTDLNWVGNVVPNFTSGGLIATFAEGGQQANFNDGEILKGIVFDAPNDFVIKAAETLHLRHAGVSSAEAPEETKRHYLVDGPVQLDCSQTWKGWNRVEIGFTGPVNHYNPDEKLYILGPEEGYDAHITLYGKNNILGGIDVKYGTLNLFGASNGEPMELNGGGELVLNGDKYGGIAVSNAVIRKQVKLIGGDKARRIVAYPRTTNVISGKVTASWTPRFYLNDDSELVMEGGFSIADGSWTVASGTGKTCFWTVRTAPLVSTDVIQLVGITLNLECPGNSWSSVSIGANTCVRYGCDYALSNATVKANFTAATSEIDLGGHRQLGGEIIEANGIAGAKITSETRGTYGFTQVADLTLDDLDVAGKASIAKYGDGTVTINRAMTSSGGLEVHAGVVTFGSQGSWVKADKVVVAGTGRLVVPTSSTFGRQTRLAVTTGEGAQIELGNGVEHDLRELVVDGLAMPQGVYGGEAAPAGATKLPIFSATGTGVVKVGPGGLRIIIK